MVEKIDKSQPVDIKHQLEKSDVDLIRLIEDLVEVLILKGVINYTDLPTVAMHKILARQRLREALKDSSPLSE